MPTVSVLMPAYNTERYIEDAAHSALRQTFTDFELIIVDDGSTDGTLALADAIRVRDPHRVRIISGPNRGIAAARNRALSASRGELLALLDSDDIWESDFLEKQVAFLRGHPDVDLVTTNGRFLGSSLHGEIVRPWPDPRPPITLHSIIIDEQAVFVMTLFRRRVFEAIGGFDESLRTNEDFDYWFRAALAGFRFGRNAEPLTWYRRREGSLSSDAIRMLQGALHVCVKHRAACARRPERDDLERQIAYYEAELDAALARRALEVGDTAEAAKALDALHERRPSLRNAVAALLARRAGPLLTTLYQLKRACRA